MCGVQLRLSREFQSIALPQDLLIVRDFEILHVQFLDLRRTVVLVGRGGPASGCANIRGCGARGRHDPVCASGSICVCVFKTCTNTNICNRVAGTLFDKSTLRQTTNVHTHTCDTRTRTHKCKHIQLCVSASGSADPLGVFRHIRVMVTVTVTVSLYLNAQRIRDTTDSLSTSHYRDKHMHNTHIHTHTRKHKYLPGCERLDSLQDLLGLLPHLPNRFLNVSWCHALPCFCVCVYVYLCQACMHMKKPTFQPQAVHTETCMHTLQRAFPRRFRSITTADTCMHACIQTYRHP